MKIKVCGMKHPHNIANLGKLPVDMMGLIFYEKSSRFAGGLSPKDLEEALPGNISRVGVFVDASPDYVCEMAKKYGLSMLQLHGKETTHYLHDIGRRSGLALIKAFNVSQKEDFEATEAYAGAADYFLFDTKTEQHGGSGQKFDWEILGAYKGRTPFLLSGGISDADAQQIVRLDHKKLFAIDINSRFEEEPGLKDISRIEQFIKQIHTHEQN